MTTRTLLTRLRSRRGGVTILAAVMFPALIGIAGLATEYGDALMMQIKAQRLADDTAYAGALAYMSAGSTTAMTNAADQIATLNGLPTADLTAISIVSSPSGDGNSAVQATVSIAVPLGLSQLVNSGTSQATVTANSYVELKGGSIPCFIALSSPGTGITLSGAGKITANSCAVSSDATTTSPASIVAPSSSATVTTPVVSTPQALTTTQRTYILPPTGTPSVTYQIKSVADPLASNSNVTNAVSRLASVGLQSNPSIPTIPASTTDVNLTGSSWSAPGCTSSKSSSTWTVTCSGAGPFNFRNLTIGGGETLNFNVGSLTAPTFNFSGNVSTGSDTVTFGAGTYNIAQGLTNGSGTVTFKGGTFNIANYSSGTTCASGSYSITNGGGGSITFSGQSTFVLPCGISDGGGATIILGSGSTSNSYKIGSSSSGYAITMGGSGIVTLNDATGTNDVFQANGIITNGGGACLTLPAATQHDINGSVTLAGGGMLGSGIYTIYGYMGIGAISGGTVSCNGSTVGLTGSAVTLVLGGNTTVSCGSSVAFCVAGGYSNVTLTAPTSGTTSNIAVIGPTTSTNTAGATLTAGATGTSISGAFYFPYGSFSMGGAANIGGVAGGCLEIIAAQINVTAGAAAGSTCSGLGGAAIGLPTSIVLVK